MLGIAAARAGSDAGGQAMIHQHLVISQAAGTLTAATAVHALPAVACQPQQLLTGVAPSNMQRSICTHQPYMARELVCQIMQL
jgi:hypothetical protein